MENPVITFVVNGKTYSLRASDSAALGAIPQAERQQLIALLEAVKQQDDRARALVQQAVDKAKAAAQGPQAGARAPRPERLGSGDVDALMARLVMEEQRSRKPGPTRQDLYKWVLGVGVVIVLLVLVL
ncbi:MAG: hypothetical protein OEW92_05715 [Gammaproteobacteria bacterium]|jgi:hypothetical protein|nr:hypothetical protein [Gammaproteobacteria bacterium]MDH5171896.1 hypothetical protein [Gammaproteobacteria bacterium]